MAINLNELAKTITMKEGKKLNLSIAQVKEVLKITLHELADEDVVKVLTLLKKYQSKKASGR